MGLFDKLGKDRTKSKPTGKLKPRNPGARPVPYTTSSWVKRPSASYTNVENFNVKLTLQTTSGDDTIKDWGNVNISPREMEEVVYGVPYLLNVHQNMAITKATIEMNCLTKDLVYHIHFNPAPECQMMCLKETVIAFKILNDKEFTWRYEDELNYETITS